MRRALRQAREPALVLFPTQLSTNDAADSSYSPSGRRTPRHFILFLALSPPDGPRAPLNTTMAPARGALVDAGHHPETRQFLIRAAIKRADELNRLRELPDTPTRTAPAEPAVIEPAPAATAADEPKIAGLPADRIEADPEPDEPAATETPSVRIPPGTRRSLCAGITRVPEEHGFNR
jgi:hypothetical protein